MRITVVGAMLVVLIATAAVLLLKSFENNRDTNLT